MIFRNIKTVSCSKEFDQSLDLFRLISIFQFVSCQFRFAPNKNKFIVDVGIPKDGQFRHDISILDYEDDDLAEFVPGADFRNQ